MMKTKIIRIVTPLTLRSKRRVCQLLRRFAITEADSAWQLIQALNRIDDDELKARLFHNAMEELHHAELFGGLADQFSDHPPSAVVLPRRHLFAESPSPAAFEAYHYVGELDVFEQFEAYARAAPLGPIRDTFLAIRADESGHQLIAREALVRLAGSNAKAKRLVRSVRRQRLWDSLKRGANAIGDAVSVLLLTGIFSLFGPFVTFMCRRRLKAIGWNDEITASGVPRTYFWKS